MKKITLVGGDRRMKILKESLSNTGYFVDTIGLFENDNGNIATSQIVVLPVPTTKDKKTVFCPITNREIPLSYIEENTNNHQLILCCNHLFENRKCIDYGALDSYALLNAVPTAEGAIKIAIEQTPYTLWRSKVLVIGYGRVGKILANRLMAMGCDVTVSARKPAHFAILDALGFKTAQTEKLSLLPLDYDIIFNTVDIKVIEDYALETLKCDLLVDLSSLGGFNLELAKSLKLNAIKAPGLPSIIAPKTAAEILCKTVLHVIDSHN